MVIIFTCQQVARCWYGHKYNMCTSTTHRFLPYRAKGPGFDSMSPANISSSFLQGVVRREGASSPTVPPPPLPLDTHAEEERRDTNVEVKMIYLE